MGFFGCHHDINEKKLNHQHNTMFYSEYEVYF